MRSLCSTDALTDDVETLNEHNATNIVNKMLQTKKEKELLETACVDDVLASQYSVGRAEHKVGDLGISCGAKRHWGIKAEQHMYNIFGEGLPEVNLSGETLCTSLQAQHAGGDPNGDLKLLGTSNDLQRPPSSAKVTRYAPQCEEKLIVFPTITTRRDLRTISLAKVSQET